MLCLFNQDAPNYFRIQAFFCFVKLLHNSKVLLELSTSGVSLQWAGVVGAERYKDAGNGDI